MGQPSQVWDAYTKSEILDQWWGPKPWYTKTKSMDFREGGRWLYAMCGPEGQEHWSFLDYIKIQNQKVFTGIDGFFDKEGNINNDLPQSNWKLNLVNWKIIVWFLKITFSSLAQLDAIIEMGFKEGITIAMEGLDSYLESVTKNKTTLTLACCVW